MLNLNKHTKTNLNLKLTLIFKDCSYVCVRVSLCTTVVNNTAQNSSDNFPSYPPDNYQLFTCGTATEFIPWCQCSQLTGKTIDHAPLITMGSVPDEVEEENAGD